MIWEKSLDQMTPTISIITPTLNAASTLGETLLSAVPDDARLVEHLLIDALSSDGTLDVAGKFSGLNIFSEMDQGIYDGMNKGPGGIPECHSLEWLSRHHLWLCRGFGTKG